MLQQVAVAEQARGREHGVCAAGGRLHHAGDSGSALDVDVGERGSRLRDTREGQVARVGVVACSRPRELAAGAADEFAGRVAGHDRVVIGERGGIRRHRIGRRPGRVQGHVEQRLHIGIGIPGQRRAGLIIGQEVTGRDDRHMIVVDHMAQGADDRGDLARLDILHVRENQRAVLRELGNVGEVGLGQEVIGDAGSFRLMLCRHEQLGIGCFTNLPAAEIQRGSRRGINDADLLDGAVYRDQSRGISDDVLRRVAEIAGQSCCPVVDQGGEIDRLGCGPAGRCQQRLRDCDFDTFAIAGGAEIERCTAVELGGDAG